MKFRAHKRLFRALGTIVFRKFGQLPISHKVRGSSDCSYLAGVLEIKSRAVQIGHRVANGSLLLQHFFKRSCIAWVQWHDDMLCKFVHASA